MSRLDEIQELFEYNRWANERILDAVSNLSEDEFTRDLGSSFASIRDSLVHVLAADWIWLSRWNGVSPSELPVGWKESGFGELRERMEEVEAGRSEFLGKLDEGDLDRVVSYRTTAGAPHRSRVSQMLRHVVNHSTYHRGQVVTMLRQLGSEAPSTDLILYFRTVAKERL